MAPSKGWDDYPDAGESSTVTRSGHIQTPWSYPNARPASVPTVGGGGTGRLDKYAVVVEVEEGEPAGCSEKEAVARCGYHTGRCPDTAPRRPTPVGAELTGLGIEGGTRADDMPMELRGEGPTPVGAELKGLGIESGRSTLAKNYGDMPVDVSCEGVHRRPTPFGAELKALGIEGGTRPLHKNHDHMPVEVEEGAPAACFDKDVARCGYRSSPTPARLCTTLAGSDLMTRAQTGSGKASAFCLPVAAVGRGGGGGRGDKDPYIYDRTAKPPALVLAPDPRVLGLNDPNVTDMSELPEFALAVTREALLGLTRGIGITTIS